MLTGLVEHQTPLDEEALFREARRLRRRRWTIGLLIAAIALGGSAAIVVISTSGRGANTTTSTTSTAGVLPNGSFAALHVAGPLAVAADGALYVTNVVGAGLTGGDRVLVRLPDGRFRVVAGDGKVGFSGDGGPAVRAELSSVSDLVFAPDGTLYIADGGRVRTVSRDGVIRTIAGNGQPRRTITNGTTGMSAALGTGHPNPLQIALSPAGHLYIATGGPQLLRLTAAGKLDTVRTVVASGPFRGRSVGGWYPIAVDAYDNIDVGGGPNGWSIWQVAPNGVAHYIGYARGSGGSDPILQPGPGGAIYAGPGVARIEPRKLAPISNFNVAPDGLRGQYFPLTYFAFSPNGALYADDIPGNLGFERHQQLVSVTNHHTSLLWQENNSTPK